MSKTAVFALLDWFHIVRNSVWKFQKFTLSPFLQKFRQSNIFKCTKKVTKELISRNFSTQRGKTKISLQCNFEEIVDIKFTKFLLINHIFFYYRIARNCDTFINPLQQIRQSSWTTASRPTASRATASEPTVSCVTASRTNESWQPQNQQRHG